MGRSRPTLGPRLIQHTVASRQVERLPISEFYTWIKSVANRESRRLDCSRLYWPQNELGSMPVGWRLKPNCWLRLEQDGMRSGKTKTGQNSPWENTGIAEAIWLRSEAHRQCQQLCRLVKRREAKSSNERFDTLRSEKAN